MTVELIYDLDCPNVGAARSHLMKAFAQAGVSAKWIEWDRGAPNSPPHAQQFGSPTILVDGNDVAGECPRDDSNCCRLYRDTDAAMQGAPSVELIARALQSNRLLTAPPAASGGSSGWKNLLATLPGILFAFLPKLACPACWPAYAGLLSSVGLGFLIETKYLLAMTIAFLVLATGALAFRASARRGYGPFALGLVAAIIVLVGKFVFESDVAMYGGIGLLVAASIWNAWPVRKGSNGCPACVTESSLTPIEESS